ncbi:uncharacterized protein LOC143024974 [Oratosquilla oratoria]|uniref:uncharacterized protein LOC143024974 n=1 Tax=Oratosquilla oratoria TaxID=337810 RepID=UPI003F76EFD1
MKTLLLLIVATLRAAQTCDPGHFSCSDGWCVTNRFWCNGYNDCSDGSDEANCTVCEPGYLLCPDNYCIQDYRICDSIYDCLPSRFDELDCPNTTAPCADDYFTCADGVCIHKDLVCDGWLDCEAGGEDEQNCGECRPGAIRCFDDSCVPILNVCDGIANCPGQEDEAECTSCREGFFHCQDNVCVQNAALCDGSFQCIHHEDEANCDRFTDEGLTRYFEGRGNLPLI